MGRGRHGQEGRKVKVITGIAARDRNGEIYAVRLGGILRASRIDPDLSRVVELGYVDDGWHFLSRAEAYVAFGRPPRIRLDG
jgi:hypothetical protein